MKKVNQKGFSLIELLVVIGIISILATGAIAYYSGAQKKARDAMRLSDMGSLHHTFELFFIDNVRYPGNANDGIDNGGEYIGDDTGPIETALTPYYTKLPVDPAHDAVSFYYAYDPTHSVDGCVAGPPDTKAVFGFYTAEHPNTQVIKDTCTGNDMDLDDADYNVALQDAG